MSDTGKNDALATPLVQQNIRPINKSDQRLDIDTMSKLMLQLPEWKIDHNERTVERAITGSYLELGKILREIAELSDRLDHHPKLILEYASLRVSLTTHSIDNISINDLVLAAQIDRLLQQHNH